MKTINYKIFTAFLLFFSLCQIQSVFAGDDVPLKKDDGTGTAPNVMTPSRMSVTTNTTFIPVSATINETELIIDFTSNVSTAYISVVDANGSIVYQTVADTFNSTEVIIPLDGLTAGKYTLKISYSTTKLSGVFNL